MQITETMNASSLFSTQSLIKQVSSYLEELEDLTTADGLTKYILSDFTALSNYFIAIGDQQHNEIEAGNTPSQDEVYLLHFALSENFKDLTLLHRDVALQLQISKYKQLESSVSQEKVITHFQNSKDVLSQAIISFAQDIENERALLYKSEKSGKKIYNKIKHRKNPWHIYKGQFQSAQKQIKSISFNTGTMSKTIKLFEDIKAHISSFIETIKDETNALRSELGEGIRLLKDLENPEQITEVITWIDTATKTTSKVKDLQEVYMPTIELKTKMLSETTLPVATEDGLLLTRKVNFNKDVKRWIDFEILPLLIDLLEHKNKAQSFFNHSLANLKTGLLVEKNNNSLEAVASQLNTLKSVHATISGNADHLDGLIKEIQLKFDTYFQVSKVYSDTDFLEVSLQSSLSQFASDQSTLFSGLKAQLKNKFSRFNSKYESSLRFQSQNKIEAATACINYRMFKEENAHYDTLFLNKNFIGDLFLIPRAEQEKALQVSIEQWESGFNKAILITGDSLSGKTTFINAVAQNHFAKNNVILEKDSQITYRGRKFTTTSNLGDALQNIKKGSNGNRALLVIDTIELWRDEEHSLLDNIRSLINFIENESDEILVAITTTQQMKDHLDKRLNFTSVFTNMININKATFEEIYKAVVLRHGASHKQLVGSNEEGLSNNEIEKEALKLARAYDYNIGEVLQAWTYGTTMIADNKVVYNQQQLPFGDFFTPEEIIILKYVLLYKMVNELMIKNFVGSRFELNYKSGLKRLVNTKVLIREANGYLMLNKVIEKDAKQLLIYKGTLN